MHDVNYHNVMICTFLLHGKSLLLWLAVLLNMHLESRILGRMSVKISVEEIENARFLFSMYAFYENMHEKNKKPTLFNFSWFLNCMLYKACVPLSVHSNRTLSLRRQGSPVSSKAEKTCFFPRFFTPGRNSFFQFLPLKWGEIVFSLLIFI